MRIAIDATVLDRKMTGTGRYLLNLLKEIPLQDHQHDYFLFSRKKLPVDSNFFISIPVGPDFLPEKLFSIVWLNLIFPIYIRKFGIDLVLSPNLLTPSNVPEKVKTISVVHDVIFRIYPECYSFLYRIYLAIFLPASLRRSDKIITVSECAKQDIVDTYGIESKKLEVIYNTVSETLAHDSGSIFDKTDASLEGLLPKKYILYVGVLEKRKNIKGLLQVVDILIKKNTGLKLVLVGRPGYDFKAINREMKKRESSIVYLNSLSDVELNYVYQRAFAFIFPSLYEGFGIPPLEAMSKGIPVVVSNSSSLPEVVGSGGLLREPSDYAGFAEDILKLETQPELYSQMKKKALDQSKKFNIADETKKLIRTFNETYSL